MSEHVVGADADVDRRGGRPSLSGAAAPSPRIVFRVSPEVRRRAEALARGQRRSVSELAREALERYLDAA